ncbi:MAG: Uma2 family endonuclease, partial [Planctomycetota bacterium]
MNERIRETHPPYGSSAPALNSGDMLDHHEYVRRYASAPDKLKAERINGRVYLMKSLRAVTHGNPHALLSFWLSSYVMSHPDLVVSDNATVRLNDDNDPQPDLCMVRIGGQTHTDEAGYLNGPPELIVEIAGSSASYDFGEKQDVYENAGVGEYVVFETLNGRVEWWCHNGVRFIDSPRDSGRLKSLRFPGLWLDVGALQNADRYRLIDTLQEGM